MTRALAALLVLLPVSAWAIPTEGTTRIAVEGGWRYVPNALFGTEAAASGHPLEQASSGGPAGVAVFGYRPMQELEIAIDIGFAYESWKLAAVGEAPPSTMKLTHMPISLVARYAPWMSSRFYPYVGGGAGYFLNFFTGVPGPSGGVESHGAGPLFVAGIDVDLTDRVAAMLEYRLGFSRVELPGVGYVNTGGNLLLVGLEFRLPQEDSRLH